MTYTFKLSRRLARLRCGAMLATALLSVSCAPDGPSGPGDFSSPNAVVDITPEAAAVGVQRSVQFAASTSMDQQLTPSVKGGKGKGRGRGNQGEGGVSVEPLSVTLKPKTVQRFTATQTLTDGSSVQPTIRWSAKGGTIDSTGLYTAGSIPGQYRVIALTSDGLADTAVATVVDETPVVDRVVLTPETATLESGSTQRFTASGKASDGSSVSITPTYTSKGGTITAEGLYTAGLTAGNYRVIATDPLSGLADTSTVTITAPSPTLQAVVLTPASVSLVAGSSQQFAAAGKMSDGSTVPITATFAATGGTITPGGLYTAGATTGSFRVVATQTEAMLADTAAVSISGSSPSPSPVPSTGTTYFLADAESGTVSPPWVYWGVYGNDAPTPVSSTNRARNGSRSFRFETDSCAGHASCSSFLTTNKPQVSMGCAQGNFCSGWYSAYLYVDAGWTESSWDAVFNFMASLPQIDPIGHVGLNFHDGVLQLYWNMKNCQVGHYVCPNISGYTNRNGDYYMSASSPAGIVPFPRSRWVHVAVYYGMARTNGKIQIWQDGVLIENLTASTLNTLDGNMRFNNSGGDIGNMGVGEYHGALTEPVRRLYADDFRVSSYRPLP
jgi:hypothetical protein